MLAVVITYVLSFDFMSIMIGLVTYIAFKLLRKWKLREAK